MTLHLFHQNIASRSSSVAQCTNWAKRFVRLQLYKLSIALSKLNKDSLTSHLMFIWSLFGQYCLSHWSERNRKQGIPKYMSNYVSSKINPSNPCIIFHMTYEQLERLFNSPQFLLFSRILLKSVTFIRNNNFLFEPDRPIWCGYQWPGILGQLNRPLVVWRPFIFHDIVSCGFVSGCNVSSLAQLTVCQYLGNSVKGRF